MTPSQAARARELMFRYDAVATTPIFGASHYVSVVARHEGRVAHVEVLGVDGSPLPFNDAIRCLGQARAQALLTVEHTTNDALALVAHHVAAGDEVNITATAAELRLSKQTLYNRLNALEEEGS